MLNRSPLHGGCPSDRGNNCSHFGKNDEIATSCGSTSEIYPKVITCVAMATGDS